jgi:hypothetical protein
MDALAFESAPAHTTSGKLQATLFDCNGKNLAQGETIVPSGGTHGTTGEVFAGAATVSCGQADAVFVGFDPHPGDVQGILFSDKVIG